MQNQTVNGSGDLQKHYASGRSTLLTLLIFTVVNVVLMVLGAGYYFVFSASIPYYLMAFVLDLGGRTLGMIFLAIAVGFTALLLLSWLLSKKQSGWMICGMVLVIVDTLVLLGLCLLIPGLFAENIMDFIFHAVAIYSTVQAVIAAKKLKAQTPDFDQGADPSYNGSPEF